MTSDWLLLLACTGCTAILVNGTIFNRPREWLMQRSQLLKEFLSCSLCVGCWVGFLAGYLQHGLTLKYIMLYGFASAACSWLYDSLVGMIQAIEVDKTK